MMKVLKARDVSSRAQPVTLHGSSPRPTRLKESTYFQTMQFPGEAKVSVAGPGTGGEFMAGIMTLVL
jgi:hypothetical protein